jgi:hypothetical protein
MLANAVHQRSFEHAKLFDLFYSDENQFIEVCQLMKQHTNISLIRDVRSGSECKTLLHHAAKEGNMRIIKFLLRYENLMFIMYFLNFMFS